MIRQVLARSERCAFPIVLENPTCLPKHVNRPTFKCMLLALTSCRKSRGSSQLKPSIDGPSVKTCGQL